MTYIGKQVGLVQGKDRRIYLENTSQDNKSGAKKITKGLSRIHILKQISNMKICFIKSIFSPTLEFESGILILGLSSIPMPPIPENILPIPDVSMMPRFDY